MWSAEAPAEQNATSAGLSGVQFKVSGQEGQEAATARNRGRPKVRGKLAVNEDEEDAGKVRMIMCPNSRVVHCLQWKTSISIPERPSSVLMKRKKSRAVYRRWLVDSLFRGCQQIQLFQ
jgi:hypothetical protein